jgi:hypothetical protein
VVVEGATVADPLAATAPTDGEIETFVAFNVDHDSVEFCPLAIIDGVAVNDETDGGGGSTGVTVIDVCPVTLPALLVAVSV